MISLKNTIRITLLVIILLLSGCIESEQHLSIDNQSVIHIGNQTNHKEDNISIDNLSIGDYKVDDIYNKLFDLYEDEVYIENQGFDMYEEDTPNTDNQSVDYPNMDEDMNMGD